MSGSKRNLAIGAVILAAVAAIGGAGLLYVNKDDASKGVDAVSTTSSPLAVHANGPLERLLTPEPVLAPDYTFFDDKGAPVTFADFAGKVTVVNLWATWCAPCKIEMPTLAALAKRYEAREDFAVAVISMDTDRAQEAAKAFISENAPLKYYTDPKFQLAFEFPGKGAMPQTMILDRDGKVVAVMVGEADWNGPEAVALIEDVLK